MDEEASEKAQREYFGCSKANRECFRSGSGIRLGCAYFRRTKLCGSMAAARNSDHHLLDNLKLDSWSCTYTGTRVQRWQLSC